MEINRKKNRETGRAKKREREERDEMIEIERVEWEISVGTREASAKTLTSGRHESLLVFW